MNCYAKIKTMKKTKRAVKRQTTKILIIIVLSAFVGFSTKHEAQKSSVVKELPKMVQSTAQPVLASNSVPTTTIQPIPVEPTDMKEWVKWKTGQAGLKWEDVKCLIDHESGWREMAYFINRGEKSLDRGLWMWNDKWNSHISNECSFDFKCSTIEAIKKIKHDGNYNAWYGYKNNCK